MVKNRVVINIDLPMISLMSESSAAAEEVESLIGKYVSRMLYSTYAALMVVCIVILFAGIFFGFFVRVFITIPVIIVLADALFTDRKTVHIPPFMIFMMAGVMFLILLGNFMDMRGFFAESAVDFLFGAVMGLGGLIITYSFIPAIPDIDRKRPITMIFISISVALSLFMVLVMFQYYLSAALGEPSAIMNRLLLAPPDGIQSLDAMMTQLLFVTAGAFTVSISFYLGRRSARIRRAVVKYLQVSNATIGIDEYEQMEIRKALASGESEKVEYKSTLRTNLGTGETDEKIERSVLKTIVAFLNSKGGTLLIGIADDGSVIGVDEENFENRDKMNLHLTNLIATHIGNEFLPFISFRMTDYHGKVVMRIECRKSDGPVFLKEWPNEYFIVRSGPSSVELQGMDTLNYVENRFKKR
jgi:hypothetical protein